jgi:hypothetical protein
LNHLIANNKILLIRIFLLTALLSAVLSSFAQRGADSLFLFPNNIKDADSLFASGLGRASENAVSAIDKAFASYLNGLKKNTLPVPGIPGMGKDLLKPFKKFSLDNSSVGSEANGWKVENNNSVFLQNKLLADFSFVGIPVSTQLFDTHNFYGNATTQKITYKVGYNRDAFARKLGIDKQDFKNKLSAQLDLKDKVDYKKLIEGSFASVPGISQLLSSTGCNWDQLLEMPQEQFARLYGPDALKSKMADAEKLKRYYSDYAASKLNPDSLILKKINQADSGLTRLKKEAELYEKLLALKKEADVVTKKMKALKKFYDEKLEKVKEGYDVFSSMAKNDKDLTSLQRFMLKIKGVNIGQHTLTSGTLALQNYLQNGFTFEYEADKMYLLVTAGSQEKLEYANGFFQASAAAQNGLTEYYQYGSRYRLAGISIGRGSRGSRFQQVSLMNFKKINLVNNPSLFSKVVNVVTIGNQFAFNGRKLSYALSKSIIGNERNYSDSLRGGNSAATGSFFQSLALDVKYEMENKETQEKRKFALAYTSLLYNNPGLNGGVTRPGIQLSYAIDKNISSNIKLSNQLTWYSLKYGSGTVLKSGRERLNLTYKIKKSRVGILVNGSYGTQSLPDPKSVAKTRAADFLGTFQTHKRFGGFFTNISAGAGYGFDRQDQFSISSSYSFFVNNSIGYKNFSLAFSADKFNTRNTEVFIRDSTALILVSNFNLDGSLSYTSDRGDLFQLGMQYKSLDKTNRQFFITGNLEWTLFKKITIGGTLNLPVLSQAPYSFITNTFNSKIIYNINGHD